MPSTKEIPITPLLFTQSMMDAYSKTSTAVLASGGIESASLICILKQYFESIHPIYMRLGMAWENVEHQYLCQYLEAVKQPGIAPLKILDTRVDNIYGNHWSVTGANIPDANTSDEAVYLPGRNLLFLTQAAVWSSLNGIHHIAVGSLATNPFPDATNNFFIQLQKALTSGLNFDIKILRPFGAMHKHEVIALAQHLPLHLTFSCINPTFSNKAKLALHCGRCNKCAERQQAFVHANVVDRTTYASQCNP